MSPAVLQQQGLQPELALALQVPEVLVVLAAQEEPRQVQLAQPMQALVAVLLVQVLATYLAMSLASRPSCDRSALHRFAYRGFALAHPPLLRHAPRPERARLIVSSAT